jgi:hypothetical protein
MFQKGVISQRLISFYMTDSDHQSFIEFGGYDTAKMSDSNLFQWIPMANNLPFWTVGLTGFRVGDNPTI